ncbi:MAG: hypothetical protein NZM05_12550, partial [Chloroherpetonaceae bacterium]|nr:hypothetical protein [Chloroherpetonaceae bacterium]
VADTRHACNACLLAEAEDWQAFLQKHSFLPPATVLLICDSPTPKRTFRELEALGVRFPILFDTTGQIFQALNSRGSLEVFFLYRHRVLCRYEPNVGNRALTQAMQKKFRDFIALSAGQRGRLI